MDPKTHTNVPLLIKNYFCMAARARLLQSEWDYVVEEEDETAGPPTVRHGSAHPCIISSARTYTITLKTEEAYKLMQRVLSEAYGSGD